MNPNRRYGKMIKRIVIFLSVYVITAYLFVGVSPSKALLHPGASLSQYRGFVVYMIVILSLAVGQFAAIFWFMARENDYASSTRTSTTRPSTTSAASLRR